MSVFSFDPNLFFGNPFFIPIFNVASLVILALTALAGFLSSRATAKANELKLLPLPVIYFKGIGLENREIWIKNVGEGTAYGINIDTYLQILTDIQRIWKLRMKITGTNVLERGEERRLKVDFYENDKESQAKDFMVFHLDPDEDHERTPVRLFITFRNAAGDKYYCQIQTGKNGLNIYSPPKRLFILGRILMVKDSLKTSAYIFLYKYIVWKMRKPYIAWGKSSKN